MDSPRQTLDGALDRANEIIWWNRSLTKLNQFDQFGNAKAFVDDQLVEQKGPYVEYVRTPKSHTQSAEAFLSELNYDPSAINAVANVLFDGDPTLPLYQHQAEMIKAIEGDENDNILAVPTATGKTESFFIPLLNDCIQIDKDGLKGIIIYPMKTLEVDQLNRFIKYLDAVNRDRPAGEKIKIGIWDGDTDNTVGDQPNEVEPGSPIRGLVCPRTKEKLRVFDDYRVGTDTEEYSWIRVTRNGIRADNQSQSVDILITNPEALDFLYVNDRRDSRNIIGENPGEHPLQHIVYDEAHVWSGIKGAAISLLSQRLKHFYEDSDPQISMVSATVKNPPELASKLTRTPMEEINSVGFTPEPLPSGGTADFTKIHPCTLDEIVATLYVVSKGEYTVNAFEAKFPKMASARATLAAVNLLTIRSNAISIPSEVRSWLVSPILEEVDSLKESYPQAETGLDVIENQETLDLVTETLLDSNGLTARWRQHIERHVPEVAELASKLEGDTGEVRFRRYDGLLADVRSELDESQDPELVLNTLLLFGRLAGLLTDKYHVFLQPPSNAYWCRDCSAVRRQKACPSCHSNLPELEFCRECHYPYVVENEEDGGRPLEHPTASLCPGCEKTHNTQDINVPTSTLLTFMLTELCRLAPSKKTLVFSDSRSTSESVARNIRDQEYLLMAETLYVKHLVENKGTKETTQLFYDIRDELREVYYEPLISNAPDGSNVEDYLNDLLSSIRNNASLHNCNHLLNAALVTPETIFQSYSGRELALAHVVYRTFAQDPGYKFTRDGRKIQGWSFERLESRIHRNYRFEEEFVQQSLPRILDDLNEVNAIRARTDDEVHEELQNQSGNAPVETTKAYLEKQQAVLDQVDVFKGEIGSGVFKRELQNDESRLRLVPSVAYCLNCYTAMPAKQMDTDIGINCPKCRQATDVYDRFEVREGEYVGKGYADIDTGWDYAVDHWGHDISSPFTENEELEPVVVGQHKGDMPAALRGSIEEGFRQPDPEINIVSATPTMELGVDIGTLDTVTQVGIPPTLTNYVQRSGRTGRSQGSASLVTTAVRSSNPVDTHYFANLDAFFSSYDPVRVPNPVEFDELLAGQIVTEAVGYLARNQGGKSVLDKVYQLTESTSSPRNFSTNVLKRLVTLRRYIKEERPDVKDWVVEAFGPEASPIFDEVFSTDSRYSMKQRGERTFGEMEGLDVSGKSAETLSSNLNRLDLWLKELGYLANYRSFGGQFPVNYRSSRQADIQFEGSGRLFEMFPGPENDRGGEVVYLGTKYIVDDVKARERLTRVGLCTNEECERPYGAYKESRGICPLCGEELERTAVHRIGSVQCRSAAPFEQDYRTYPIVTTYLEEIRSTADREVTEATLFGLDCSLISSQFETLSFVPAFERAHNRGSDLQLVESQGVIDVENEDEANFDDMDLDDLIEESSSEQYAPVGQQMRTNGIKLEFDLEPIEERYQQFASTEPTASWSQAMVSLEQAFAKTIAVIAQCDLGDFDVKAVKTDSSLDFYVTDGREGGNGISWQVSQAIIESNELEKRVREVGNCDECNQFCNQCLLLERTPGFYLKNDLLHRKMLLALLEAQQ
ncbi:DEAD/DEAH box helicase [Natronosalvus rutilus]|uniref:DEAD/DEAH box helicase n=1 Tax=Natronosalvus rutilus TaxID=2953753 RepID=A0A9E7SZ17_9EURY|nr:DEAD/DEAH box helicase [Natronosalvus rutilus]UTF55588.1 DEAD/DEAH box helicase [Natronosalvus rutilus]